MGSGNLPRALSQQLKSTYMFAGGGITFAVARRCFNRFVFGNSGTTRVLRVVVVVLGVV